MFRQSCKNFAAVIRFTALMLSAVLVCKYGVSSVYAMNNNSNQPKILVLHSYHPKQAWTKSIIAGLEKRFKHSKYSHAKFYHDFLDARRNSGEKYLNELASVFHHKDFIREKFNLIITTDDKAFYFLLNQGKKLFPGVPVVFCGLNDYNKQLVSKSSRPLTGVTECISPAETVAIAEKLHPECKKLYVVCDDKQQTSKAVLKETVKQLSGLKTRLKIIYLKDMSFYELIEKVRSLQSDSMILLLIFNRDSKGRIITHDQVINKMALSTSSPIYSVYSFFSGKGIVGGKVVDGFDQGEAAAGLAIKILNGKNPKDIPVINQIPATFQFDWNKLKQYSIPARSLPPNSIIINKSISLYVKWLPYIAVIVLLQAGLIIALFIFWRKGRKIRVELSRRDRQWRSLTENLPDIIFRIDREGHYLYINSANERSFKIKAEDYIGKTALQLKMPESMQDPDDNEVLAVFKNGKMVTREKEVPTANGTMILESRFVPEHDEYGNIVNVLGICRDVTEQRQVMRELSLRQFILENSNIAILILRQDGTVYFTNDSAASLLGYSSEDLMNMNFKNLKFTDSRENSEKIFGNISKKLLLTNEAVYDSPYGKKIPVEMTFNFMSVAKENFICTYISDITSRQQHEEELRLAKEKAEQSDQLKSTFLANMSHEVRTPLNGILGFAELLKYSEPTKKESQKYIDIIHDSGNSLLQIIDDILDISKVESGQMAIIKSHFSLDKQLEELYMLFEHKTLNSDGSVKLKLNFDSSYKDLIIYSDEVRLRQIMTNLISNALKFTSKGYVEFGFKKKPDSIVLFVKDTGIGIPQDKLSTVFKPFRQAEDSISRTYGGTGLGLAIVQSYTKLLGANIRLESKIGEGSTFFIELPMDTVSEVPEQTEYKKKKEIYDWNGKTLLVVEDDRTSFLFLNKILSETNVEIIHVESGEHAINVCANNSKIDIVLMDVRLPDINGWDATARIKASNPDIPVVIETANALAADKEKSIKSGCDGFLTKPIRKDELLSTLDTILFDAD